MKNLILVLFGLVFSQAVFAVPTALTPVTFSEASQEPAFADADSVNGNSIVNPNGDLMLYFNNPGADAAVVTITAQTATTVVKGYGSLSKSNITCALAAGEHCFAGPLNTKFWNLSGKVQVTYSGAGAADVDVLAFKVQVP